MTLRLNGSTSGYVEIDAPAVAANNTLTLPSSGELVAATSGNIDVTSINDLNYPTAGGFTYRNLIINPGFTINQRGGTRTPGTAVYGFDRWRGAQDGAAVMLEQIIEDAPAGQYTLSVVGGTNITTQRLSAHYANTASIAFGTTGSRTLTFNFDGTTGLLAVFVPSDVSSVQLELGEVATTHERRPHATELALCQRYFNRYNFQSVGWNTSATNSIGAFTFPVMRDTPNYSLVGASVAYGPGGQQSVSSLNGIGINNTSMRTGFVIAGGLTTNAGSVIFGTMDLEKEL